MIGLVWCTQSRKLIYPELQIAVVISQSYKKSGQKLWLILAVSEFRCLKSVACSVNY